MATRKKYATAAAAAVCALSLTACNPAAQNAAPAGGADTASTQGAAFSKTLEGTLKTSGFNPSDEVGKSRGDYATEQIKPVTVSMDTTNFDPQKFSAQAASGQVPDLIQVTRDQYVGTLADKGLIIPLDECYSLYDVKPSEYYYPATIKDVTYDGKLYAIPQFYQPNLIIANKDVMKPAGVTAAQLDTSKPDQIVEAAGKMYRAQGGKPAVLGFDADVPGSSAMWLTVFGGRPVDESGKPTLDDAKNVEAVTWMKRLMDAQGGYPAVKSFKDTLDVFGDQNQYAKNQVGAQTWGQWYINVVSATKDQVSLEGVPIKDASGQPLGYAGGSAFAIPKAGKNPSAACAWAIKATSLEAWDRAASARADAVKQKDSLMTGLFTGSPVADQKIRETYVKPTGDADFDQLIEVSYELLENTASFGGSAVSQQAKDALTNGVTLAMTGEKTPEEALKEAQATAMRAWEQSTIGKKG